MTGILLIQLGTPEAPTAKALKPYLKQFLSDPRVIENQSLKWKLILNGIILNTRPAESAKKYARIWDDKTGSPLMHHTQRQTELLQERFPDTPVKFGMMVGHPAVKKSVHQLLDQGVDRIIAFPMFPQYSATTTASATDALFKTMLELRQVPAIRFVPPYYNHPAYLDAVAAVIHDDVKQHDWEAEHLVLSYHGLPQKYAQRGDPYPTHCVRTTQALLPRLGLELQREQWSMTYQSRFGRNPWLKPYTDDVLTQLAKKGIKRVRVALPGFTADCLETVDEIGNESREVFEHAGGEHLRAVPCLNEHPKWIDAIEKIVRNEGHGWL